MDKHTLCEQGRKLQGAQEVTLCEQEGKLQGQQADHRSRGGGVLGRSARSRWAAPWAVPATVVAAAPSRL